MASILTEAEQKAVADLTSAYGRLTAEAKTRFASDISFAAKHFGLALTLTAAIFFLLGLGA